MLKNWFYEKLFKIAFSWIKIEIFRIFSGERKVIL